MKPVAAQGLSAAVATGNRVTALTALRDRLAADIDRTVSAREVAALSQRLMDVLGQLDVLARAGAAQQGGTPLDELTKRRAARAANA